MTVTCFMLHSMMFFWHRYELPAIALGWVTIDYPRMAAATTSSFQHPTRGQPQQLEQNVSTSTTVSSSYLSPSSMSPYRQIHPRTTSPLDLLDVAPSSAAITNPRTSTSIATPTTTPTSPSHMNHNSYHPGNEINHHHSTRTEASPLRPSHPSFSTTASSYSQRLLFQPNHDGGDEEGEYDDDSSYAFFMGGEVVVHRPGENQQVAIGGGATMPIARSAEFTEMTIGAAQTVKAGDDGRWLVGDEADRGTSGTSQALWMGEEQQVTNPPYRQSSGVSDEMEHCQGEPFSGTKTIHSAVDGHLRPYFTPTPSRVSDSSPLYDGDRIANHNNPVIRMETTTSELTATNCSADSSSGCEDYAYESSGLQAILEVRLTPRHRNRLTSTPSVDSLQSASYVATSSVATNATPTTVNSSGNGRANLRAPPPTFPELEPNTFTRDENGAGFSPNL